MCRRASRGTRCVRVENQTLGRVYILVGNDNVDLFLTLFLSLSLCLCVCLSLSLLSVICHLLPAISLPPWQSDDALSSAAHLISSSSAALAVGAALSWRGQPKLDDAHQSRKFAFLSHFLAELRTMHTDFDTLQRQRAAETDRLRPYFIVAEADLNAALNRLARNLVDFSKDAVQSRLMPVRAGACFGFAAILGSCI
jgi:hypothetical protein